MEYFFETTPYTAQLGKQLLVASDSTCTEYHKAKVKQKIGKDKIKIEFTHKVRISAGINFCLAKCGTLCC